VIASVREVVGGLPLVGIGGIDASNARAVIDAGANGVAVIRAIASSEDPEAAARRMKSSLGL
jgi:thiamine-phosphate pyrophosphorylase